MLVADRDTTLNANCSRFGGFNIKCKTFVDATDENCFKLIFGDTKTAGGLPFATPLLAKPREGGVRAAGPGLCSGRARPGGEARRGGAGRLRPGARGRGRDAGPGRGRRGVRRAMANVKVAVRVRPLSKRCVGAPRGGSVTSCGARRGRDGEGGREGRASLRRAQWLGGLAWGPRGVPPPELPQTGRLSSSVREGSLPPPLLLGFPEPDIAAGSRRCSAPPRLLVSDGQGGRQAGRLEATPPNKKVPQHSALVGSGSNVWLKACGLWKFGEEREGKGDFSGL